VRKSASIFIRFVASREIHTPLRKKNDTLKSGGLIRLFMGENGTGASRTAFAN
jgi:hypothetical protein